MIFLGEVIQFLFVFQMAFRLLPPLPAGREHLAGALGWTTAQAGVEFWVVDMKERTYSY
jgi:hypothetical protein